jgi:2-hydroxymuconate-semialdehyde hydrolase
VTESHPPLLLLHGGGPGVDARQNWATVLPALAESFDCIAPDLLGFGSALGLGHAGLRGPAAWAEARARQVLRVLDDLGTGRVDVVGNSSGGGAVALRLLSGAPDRFRKAILMGGAGAGGVPAKVPFYDTPTRESMYATLANLVADAEAQRPLLEAMAEPRLRSALRPGAEAAFRRMVEPDWAGAEPDLSTVTAPVLLLHGAQDRVVDAEVSRKLSERLGDARLEVVADAGHWIHVDQPQRFCELVESFVKEDARAV